MDRSQNSFGACPVVLVTPITVSNCDTSITPYRVISSGCVPSSLQETKKENIQLFCYPNPATSNLNIEFKMQKPNKAVLKIFDNFGRVVKEINNQNLSWNYNSIRLPVHQFASGIFYLQISLDNGRTYSTKFVKD